MGSRTKPDALDLDMEAYRLLWAMFYAQQDAKTRTGRYYAEEKDFGLTLDESEKALRIEVEGSTDHFSIKLIPRNTRLQYCVDQDGHFTIQNAPAPRMR